MPPLLGDRRTIRSTRGRSDSERYSVAFKSKMAQKMRGGRSASSLAQDDGRAKRETGRRPPSILCVPVPFSPTADGLMPIRKRSSDLSYRYAGHVRRRRRAQTSHARRERRYGVHRFALEADEPHFTADSGQILALACAAAHRTRRRARPEADRWSARERRCAWVRERHARRRRKARELRARRRRKAQEQPPPRKARERRWELPRSEVAPSKAAQKRSVSAWVARRRPRPPARDNRAQSRRRPARRRARPCGSDRVA